MFWQDYSWNAEEYDFLRQRLGVFDGLALFSTDGATYATSTHSADAASILQLVVSTPTLFDVIGAQPLLGRLYDANDAKPGAAPVVVISYALWQQDFGTDRVAIRRGRRDPPEHTWSTQWSAERAAPAPSHDAQHFASSAALNRPHAAIIKRRGAASSHVQRSDRDFSCE